MAKDGIIVYTSRTGFTQRYAEYLAEELNYDIKPARKANLFRVSCYPVVIYGGGLHHNKIDGIQGLIDGNEYLGGPDAYRLLSGSFLSDARHPARDQGAQHPRLP